MILVLLGVIIYFLQIYPAHATFQVCEDWNECEYPSPSPSVEPSASPSASPSEEPCEEEYLKIAEIWIPTPCPSASPEASPSAAPTDEPRPGLTNPGPGGTSGSDGHCTYDPNRSACGGTDPIIPKAAPATGRGGS